MRKTIIDTLLLVTITVSFALDVQARVLRVEQDGSGDYETIYEALDVAAEGDTIRIGPGRYTETRPFETPAWTDDAYVGIRVDNLTLIGAGPEDTIIGPEEDYVHNPPANPRGIIAVDGLSGSVSDMWIENVAFGIYWFEGDVITIDGCAVSGCLQGVRVTGAEARIIETRIDDFLESGVTLYSTTSGSTISDCQFTGGSGIGCSVNFTDNCRVSNCVFQGQGAGLQYSFGSTGVVDSLTIESTISGMDISLSAAVTMNDCRITGGSGKAVVVTNGGYLAGERNVLTGGDIAALRISGSTVELHNSHIMKSNGLAVQCGAFVYPPVVYLNLENNYWGTDSADSISAWIWDGNDDSAIHAIVEFMPFSPDELPTEKKTLSEFKALYR